VDIFGLLLVVVVHLVTPHDSKEARKVLNILKDKYLNNIKAIEVANSLKMKTVFIWVMIKEAVVLAGGLGTRLKGAIKLALERVKADEVFILNGDTFLPLTLKGESRKINLSPSGIKGKNRLMY